MRARNVWQALATRGYLLSAWPLRAAAYLALHGLAGMLALLVAAAVLAAGGMLAIVVVGIPLLGALALLGLPVGAFERWSSPLMDARPLPNGHRIPPRAGPIPWLRTRFGEPATWRELGYAVLLMVVLWPLDLLAVALGLTVPVALLATPVLLATVGDGRQVNVLKAYPVTSWPMAFAVCAGGALTLIATAYGLGLLAGARGALTRALITSPNARLSEQVVELTRSRVRLVDAFEAERDRIERDLHDGAQQRLIALTMMLGVARLDAPPGPLADQLARANDEAGKVLVELRDLIRGIHPPVLTDFGLQAAVLEIAARSVTPIDVSLELPLRFPRPIESTAYFVIAEALSNIARHSGASRGEITGGYAAGHLTVVVCDNGRGGIDLDAGTGLLGLADRVSVVDGTMKLSSPRGGPSRIVVEIPCRPLPDSE